MELDKKHLRCRLYNALEHLGTMSTKCDESYPSPRSQAVAYFRDLQDRICAGLEEIDGNPFRRTPGSVTAAAADGRASWPTAASSRRPASTSPKSSAQMSPEFASATPRRRAATSPPPASRWCCIRAARWCRPSTPTSASSPRATSSGSAAAPI